MPSCLIVLAVVAWRSNEFYTGGFDSVVMAKAFLSLVAFAIVLFDTRRAPTRLSVAPVLWLAAYAALAVLGAFVGDGTVASLVLVVRLIVTASVVLLLVDRHGAGATVGALTGAMALVALVSAVTGAPSLSEGRLEGGIPAMTPNEISLLSSAPVVVLMYRWTTGRLTGREGVLTAALLAVGWLTASRTGLAALAAAVVLVIVTGPRRFPPSFYVAGSLLFPVVTTVLVTTSVVADLFLRGGVQSVTTLSSRTYAWRAALELADDFWTRWFGQGLSLKEIPVDAPFWYVQGLDSSWFSALVQVGWVGVCLVVAWSATTIVRGWLQPHRALWFPLAALLVGRAALESGLFDSSAAFLLFLTCTAAVYSGSREPSENDLASPGRSDPAAVTGGIAAYPRW